MPFLIILSLSLRPWLLTMNSCSYGANDPQQLLSASFYQFRSPLNKTLLVDPKGSVVLWIKRIKKLAACVSGRGFEKWQDFEVIPKQWASVSFHCCQISLFSTLLNRKALPEYGTRAISTSQKYRFASSPTAVCPISVCPRRSGEMLRTRHVFRVSIQFR